MSCLSASVSDHKMVVMQRDVGENFGAGWNPKGAEYINRVKTDPVMSEQANQNPR